MSLKTQLQADLAVFHNTAEFAAAAVLTTPDGDFDVTIVSSGQVDLVQGGPGQSDSDTLDVAKVNATDEITITPGSYITKEDGSVWTIQTGVRHDDIFGSWACPVLSDGRVRA